MSGHNFFSALLSFLVTIIIIRPNRQLFKLKYMFFFFKNQMIDAELLEAVAHREPSLPTTDHHHRRM